ncbi:MAG: hypothetical protein OEP95_07625 [Myxococcales bacterium]|nr:hypothetical protein [Myxococcales bacterium]
MGELRVGRGQGEPDAKRGVRPVRVVKILLLLFVLSVGALLTVAVLNPEPEALRVDYGGFD